jgi:hypothetical protein
VQLVALQRPALRAHVVDCEFVDDAVEYFCLDVAN